jgi:hypothetical protein
MTASRGIGRGGARRGAGRKHGGRNSTTRQREATLKKAAEEGLMPVEFLLAEMRDLTVPREERRLIARWVAPYVSPRLATVAVVKSIREMTDAEIEWALRDAEEPQPRWNPRLVHGGR